MLLCVAEALKCKRFRQAAKWALKLELSRLLFARRCRRRQCNLIMLYDQAKKLLDHALRACLHIPRVVKPYLASVQFPLPLSSVVFSCPSCDGCSTFSLSQFMNSFFFTLPLCRSCSCFSSQCAYVCVCLCVCPVGWLFILMHKH